MALVERSRHGGVLAVAIDNPPVNALNLALREALWAAIDQADEDPAVSAIVILCRGRGFFSGADINEFDKVSTTPTLRDLVEIIERSTKPVIAAVHGSALGGGFEIALACHYRVGTPSATFALPEVTLGLVPGAGGTQRLPRLIGAELALEMVAKALPVRAAQALQVGLIDWIIPAADFVESVVSLARDAADHRPLPRASTSKVHFDPAVFDTFRHVNASRFRGYLAPEANVRCVEAATRLSIDEGMAFELETITELMASDQAKAQQYLFFAQRRAAKIDDLRMGACPRDVRRIGIIGAGTMGSGIAIAFLTSGFPVILMERDSVALRRGQDSIRAYFDAGRSKGRFSESAAADALARLTLATDWGDLADCDLVIEAVFEDMDLKKAVFEKLDAILKPSAILATNTSALDIDDIASVTSRPADVVGLHFFTPAHIMKLLEVVRGARTSDEVLVTAMGVAKALGKVAVIARVCPGFIGNRMLMPRQAEAFQLVMEGATPAQVDEVLVEFGMPMGPFQLADLAGLDLGWHRDPNRIDSISDALAARGRFGQKTRAGFYDYDERRRPSESRDALAIIDDFRRKAEVAPRKIGKDEILARTLLTMVNEAAWILAENVAQRASDIDVVWVLGYGWPAYRGGPMFWADSEGAAAIVERLDLYRDRLGPYFRLSPLLVEKARAGERFTR